MRVADVVKHLERTAPPQHQASWDASGVQVAGLARDCSKLAVALDPTPHHVEQALAWGAQLVLTHHPLMIKPRLPNTVDGLHAVLRLLFAGDAWLYAAHSSLDVQGDGPVGHLADGLELTGRRTIDPVSRERTALLHFQVKNSGLRKALPAKLVQSGLVLSADLAGQDGVECVCFDHSRRDALRLVEDLAGECSTGECPGCFISSLEAPEKTLGFGVVGDLPAPLPFDDFAAKLARLVDRDFWTLAGTRPERVRTVAYCTGSGGDLAPKAFAAGADVYITGDVKYHPALDRAGMGSGLIIDVGHFSLEEQMMRVFSETLSETLAPHGVAVKFFPGSDPFTVVRPT